MATQTEKFLSPGARNAQIGVWKAANRKGITKYTTHDGNDPNIVWVATATKATCKEGQLCGKTDTVPVGEIA